MPETRTLIGKVMAAVEFPLYDGDKVTSSEPSDFPWFEYRQPRISDEYQIGCECTRRCRTLKVEVVWYRTPQAV
jgi:hypothetical protein